MSKYVIVLGQLIGLAIMANGAMNASYGMVVIGGLIAVVGGIEYRRREHQNQR